ncbi:MAG: ATP-dependent Clp protease ATP-binding subunit, partial [Bacteroidaceae bacterium]|nr:ATP-dependent Clp protease ATP-binding subunit [Bacteroidaceae bacterium]
IIMTSNVGSRQLSEFGRGIGFDTQSTSSVNQNDNIIQKALKKQFTPEFLNRLDEVITFTSLDKTAIDRIINLELCKLGRRVEDMGYSLDVTESAIQFLAEKGYNPQMGARPLRRCIQTYLEDEISTLIINDEPAPGSVIVAEADAINDKLTLRVTILAENGTHGTTVDGGITEKCIIF